MALVSDAWMSGLVQHGPPPGANEDVALILQWYRKNSVAEVKAMASRPINNQRLLLLTGKFAETDGLLQGIYFYAGQEVVDPSRGNDESYIVVNDGKSAWVKLT